MTIPCWVLVPFAKADTEASSNSEGEVIELKIKFKMVPNSSSFKNQISFSSSYMGKRGFSVFDHLLSKNSNTECGHLRLMLKRRNPI